MGKTENSATNSRLTENEAKISYLIKDIEDYSKVSFLQGPKVGKIIEMKIKKQSNNELFGIPIN